ncbi:MAG: hypothetical protein IIT96_02030, partial [Muribaculaceae bacterium]|nr:hypothetical protein [Muribaculaceae bacterium]
MRKSLLIFLVAIFATSIAFADNIDKLSAGTQMFLSERRGEIKLPRLKDKMTVADLQQAAGDSLILFKDEQLMKKRVDRKIAGAVAMFLYNATHDEDKPFTIDTLYYYWFLFSLAYFYVISFVIGHLPDWCRWVVVAALLVFPFLTNMIWDFIILLNPEMALPSWGHVGLFTMYGLVYLYVGDFLMHHRCNRSLVIIGGIVGLVLLSVEATAVVNSTHAQFEGGNYCFPTVGALLLSIALFVLLKDWNVNNSFCRRIVA